VQATGIGLSASLCFVKVVELVKILQVLPRNRKQIFWLAVSLAGLWLWWALSFGERLSVLALAVLAVIVYLAENTSDRKRQLEHLTERVERLTKVIGLQAKESKFTVRSYELELTILPDWNALLECAANEENTTPDSLIKRIHSDPVWQSGRGLFGKSFRFVVFQDEISGMSQLFSDHHQSFVDHAAVSGWLAPIFSKESGFLGRFLVVRPEQVGFTTQYDPATDRFTDSRFASRLDFHQILRLLLNIYRHRGGSHMCAIQQFPPACLKSLQENGAVYDTSDKVGYEWWTDDFNTGENPANHDEWFQKEGVKLYEQELRSHQFKTKFYTLSMALKIF
jgi:hypothetical protein